MQLPIIGTAGWTIPKPFAARFNADGTHLQRYAAVLQGTEINSSFYRPHRRETYARWADSVPDTFSFAVKVPKEVTHTRKLLDAGEPLDRFLRESAGLGSKRHVLLVQLPPSFMFATTVVRSFFGLLRSQYEGHVACEPRHPSWFEDEADAMLDEYSISRVAADPPIVSSAALPGGWRGFHYFRWHGSPRTYYDGYTDEALGKFARQISADTPSWCMFDNTAAGKALGDALNLAARLQSGTVHDACHERAVFAHDTL